jgi:hypothetical protein
VTGLANSRLDIVHEKIIKGREMSRASCLLVGLLVIYLFVERDAIKPRLFYFMKSKAIVLY